MFARELTDIIHPLRHAVALPDATITTLATDSRKVSNSHDVLFFAIRSHRNNGAAFIPQLYSLGVRNFVVDIQLPDDLLHTLEQYATANFWFVSDTVLALQQLAAYHRHQFHIPVVAVTGSNGKTVVKDWITRLLTPDHTPVATPRSYNSQIGVPLSVWQMNDTHDIAIFEAGISRPSEMQRLQPVIDPTVGILTNIGNAHDENFTSRQQKLDEKLQLFIGVQTLIYCSDDPLVAHTVAINPALQQIQRISWGSHVSDSLAVVQCQSGPSHTTLSLCWQQQRYFEVTIPFVDRAATANALSCIALLLTMNYDPAEVTHRCAALAPVTTQLKLDEAINGCHLIYDSYSLDLESLAIALDFLQQESQQPQRTLIFSQFSQPGRSLTQCLQRVAELARWSGINWIIGVGPDLEAHKDLFASTKCSFFESTEALLHGLDFARFDRQTILLKGNFDYHFESVAKALRQSSHETVLQVDLNAMVHNLNYFRSLIHPSTKLMAMVKASSYGTGKAEVAHVLQYHRVDYLTVAYIDEGVELRRSGITLPIMVMNPEPIGFDDLVHYRLEPDIYSLHILDMFATRLLSTGTSSFPVHIELDTGMHRLGFLPDDIPQLTQRLLQPGCPLHVVSIFSHLACSDDPSMDSFTRHQIASFDTYSRTLCHTLHRADIYRHLLNSSGIARFPEAQFDMVRLGIGLYGVAPQPDVQSHLQPVSRLITRISQIKQIPQGDTVGYNCRWKATRPSRIAILSIGYADGLNRHLGDGNAYVQVNGHPAPIVGSICMDMCFIDVTDVPCSEGDEVILFENAAHLNALAIAADTIPYEILTSMSPRVKRVYLRD